MEVKQNFPQLFQAYFLHVMPVKLLVKLKGFEFESEQVLNTSFRLNCMD